jgi:thiamine biosynthesis lipoprotein
VNPHTGTFVEDKKMVSVVSKDPVVAEILTTAFMICDDERVPVIASQFDIYEKHVYKL